MNEEETLPPVRKRRLRIERGGLVQDWRRAWKWFSVQGIAFLSVAPAMYETFAIFPDILPGNTFHWLLAALGILTLISRVVKQS